MSKTFHALKASFQKQIPVFIRFFFLVLAVAFGWEGQRNFAGHDSGAGSFLYLLGWFFVFVAFLEPLPLLFFSREFRIRDTFEPPAPAVSNILFLIVLALAVHFRFYNLSMTPPNHWFDEAHNALWARDLRSESPTPFVAALGQPSGWSYLLSLFMVVFGEEPWVMRALPAIFGVLTVFVFFLFARKTVGVRGALAGAFLLAVSRWHVNFSRVNFNAIQTPFFEVLTLYFLAQGDVKAKKRYYFLAGLAFTMLLYSYLAGRMFGVLVLAYLGLRRLWDRNFFKRQGTGILIFFVTVFVFYLPTLVYIAFNAQEFFHRSGQVILFSHVPWSEAPRDLLINFKATMLQFGFQGDNNGRHNLPNAPVLDFYTSIVATLGLGYALALLGMPVARWLMEGEAEFAPKHWTALIAVLWFFIMILPGVLTIEAPQALRTIGCIPALFLCVALLWEDAWGLLLRIIRPEREAVAAALSLAFFGAAALSNWNDYFAVQAWKPEVWRAFSPAEHMMGRYMKKLNHSCRLYSDHAFYPPTVFAAGNATAHEVFTLLQNLPLKDVPPEDVQYLLMAVYKPYLPVFSYYYPGGKTATFSDIYQEPLFYAFRVKREEMIGQQGLMGEFRSGGAIKREVVPADLDWRTRKPPFGGSFSMRLTGSIFVPKTGQISFSLLAGAPASLVLDGQTFLRGRGLVKGQKLLVAGMHEIEIEGRGGPAAPLTLYTQGEGQSALSPVPATMLSPRALYPQGLLGVYYQNEHWSGDPEFERVDPEINFRWGLEAEPSEWTIEWTGSLLAEKDGQYSLGVNANQGVEITVQGHQVIQNTGGGELRGYINLKHGWHPINIRFSALYAASEIHLWWLRPGDAFPTTIASKYFKPAKLRR